MATWSWRGHSSSWQKYVNGLNGRSSLSVVVSWARPERNETDKVFDRGWMGSWAQRRNHVDHGRDQTDGNIIFMGRKWWVGLRKSDSVLISSTTVVNFAVTGRGCRWLSVEHVLTSSWKHLDLIQTMALRPVILIGHLPTWCGTGISCHFKQFWSFNDCPELRYRQ